MSPADSTHPAHVSGAATGLSESRSAISAGGILAAGEGSRLRDEGWSIPKPLVTVAGVTLVEHVIKGFLAAGIAPLGILFNEAEGDCVSFVSERFPDAPLDVHVRTTPSSFESFRLLSSRLPPGRALFSTVDAWCAPSEFVRFAESAASFPAETSVLAVTPFQAGDDERPLWVRRSPAGAVREIGPDGGDAVTAGIYLFSARAREIAAQGSFERLRSFLAALLSAGEPIASVELDQVVDVDRGSDVRRAEALSGIPSGLGEARRAER